MDKMKELIMQRCMIRMFQAWGTEVWRCEEGANFMCLRTSKGKYGWSALADVGGESNCGSIN